MFTAIQPIKTEYKGFIIEDSQYYPKIYAKNSKKLLFEALDFQQAKTWIDDFLLWLQL